MGVLKDFEDTRILLRAAIVGKARNYGVEPEAMLALYERAMYKCEICGDPLLAPMDGGFFKDKTCVDHDHKTGKLRGILCSNCNTGLGLFRDNTALLGSAAKYLRRSA